MVTGGFEKFKTRKRLQRQLRSRPDCEFVIRRFVDEQESESRSMGHPSGVSGWRVVESWLFHQLGFAVFNRKHLLKAPEPTKLRVSCAEKGRPGECMGALLHDAGARPELQG